MPELPEVETVKQGLNQVTLNQTIEGGDVLLSRAIAYPLSLVEFLAGLKGVAITQWHRRGKYLLAELSQAKGTREAGGVNHTPSRLASPAGWLGVHLRMTGQLLWLHRDEPLQKHTRVRLFFGSSHELRFVDQRTFGQIWWVPPTHLPEAVMTGLQKLGPDPFSPEFSVDYLMAQLQHRRRPIKNALLDQELVAGLGNIYADEALFKTGVRPTTLCTALSRKQLERLRSAILEVLQRSIAAGGTTFSNFLNVQGINGNYGGVAWVYHREGKPCRVCNTLVERVRLGGRSAHFCPQCQE